MIMYNSRLIEENRIKGTLACAAQARSLVEGKVARGVAVLHTYS